MAVNFEKYIPYYYNGTSWVRADAYVQSSGMVKRDIFIAVDFPILDHFVLPTTITTLNFNNQGG